jgi:acid phosphatase (class A)
MNRKSRLGALAASSLLALAAAGFAADAAAPSPAASPGAKSLHILTAAEVDPAKLLPPPAADGSELQKADLADVQRVYKTRSPDRRAQAEWDDEHETVELFFKTLGPGFDLNKLPKTAKLLAAVDDEQAVVASMAKKYFLRNRPWAIDPSLVACDYKPGAATKTSYPSGHATLSYSEGYILAALMPDKAQPILNRAQEYAYSRVVCGAHYASDIEASHVLGTELAMMLLDHPQFAADFQASRVELRAAGLTR